MPLSQPVIEVWPLQHLAYAELQLREGRQAASSLLCRFQHSRSTKVPLQFVIKQENNIASSAVRWQKCSGAQQKPKDEQMEK